MLLSFHSDNRFFEKFLMDFSSDDFLPAPLVFRCARHKPQNLGNMICPLH